MIVIVKSKLTPHTKLMDVNKTAVRNAFSNSEVKNFSNLSCPSMFLSVLN